MKRKFVRSFVAIFCRKRTPKQLRLEQGRYCQKPEVPSGFCSISRSALAHGFWHGKPDANAFRLMFVRLALLAEVEGT